MTKEQLQNYKLIKRECDQLSELLQEAEVYMNTPRTQSLTGTPSCRKDGDSETEKKVFRYLDLRERYRKQIDTLHAAQVEIEQAIETLNPTERMLIRLRYIQGLRWEDVCEQMHYSWKQTHRIHAKALARLQRTTLVNL